MKGIHQVFLIARGVWLEALRRREIYVIVILCCLVIASLAQVRFFGLESLSKFYREIALKLMGVSTALTVIVLAARQLPREFETRTIYPLLARPIHRGTFILGKLFGVLGAGAFCLGLFLLLYVLGSLMMGAPLFPALLLQHAFLQLCMMAVLASLCFLLSILYNLDAAITFGILFYVASSVFATLGTFTYATAGAAGRFGIKIFTWLLPQFMLFDLSEKTTHGEVWPPLSSAVLAQISLYAVIFTAIYLSITLLLFRRRAL
jgi:ABC-type transport system involved in multi-copper enzyme maturation permease subunit